MVPENVVAVSCSGEGDSRMPAFQRLSADRMATGAIAGGCRSES